MDSWDTHKLITQTNQVALFFGQASINNIYLTCWHVLMSFISETQFESSVCVGFLEKNLSWCDVREIQTQGSVHVMTDKLRHNITKAGWLVALSTLILSMFINIDQKC